MTDVIRRQTRLIIEKDGRYLTGAFGMAPRWGESLYDAWYTRERTEALRLAWKVHGNILLFNPVVRQKKMWRRYHE